MRANELFASAIAHSPEKWFSFEDFERRWREETKNDH